MIKEDDLCWVGEQQRNNLLLFEKESTKVQANPHLRIDPSTMKLGIWHIRILISNILVQKVQFKLSNISYFKESWWSIMWYYQSLAYFLYFTLIIFVSLFVTGSPYKETPKSSYTRRLLTTMVWALFLTCIVTLLDIRFPFGFD